jgi:hypothetical protein
MKPRKSRTSGNDMTSGPSNAEDNLRKRIGPQGKRRVSFFIVILCNSFTTNINITISSVFWYVVTTEYKLEYYSDL